MKQVVRPLPREGKEGDLESSHPILLKPEVAVCAPQSCA